MDVERNDEWFRQMQARQREHEARMAEYSRKAAAENKRLHRLMRRNIMEARAESLEGKKRAGHPDT